MIENFFIGFREGFEATLILGIAISYLRRTDNSHMQREIYLGALLGILLSIATAALFSNLAGGLTGEMEEIFEGSVQVIAAFVLGGMIILMANSQDLKGKFSQKLKKRIEKRGRMGALLFSAFAVYREGVEIILFVAAAAFSGQAGNIVSVTIGVLCAAIAGYALFKSYAKINVKKTFTVLGIVLIIFAAGIFSHGLRNFQEAKLIPVFSEIAWDSSELIDDSTYGGSLLKSLFGYDDSPTLLQVVSYLAFVLSFSFAWIVLANNARSSRSARFSRR